LEENAIETNGKTDL